MANKSEARTPGAKGIVEAAIASALASGALPAVKAVWVWAFNSDVPDWAGVAWSNAVVAVILIPFFIWGSHSISKRRWARGPLYFGGVFLVGCVACGLVWWLVEGGWQGTPHARGDRLAIFVAEFGEDAESRTVRRSVIDSIRKEFDKNTVEVLPAQVHLFREEHVADEESTAKATELARLLLKKVGGDLLIWGELQVLEGRTVAELHFVSVSEDGAEGQRFGLTERLVLEPEFGSELGSAIAGVAVAQASYAEQNRYVNSALMPIANRLKLTVNTLPPSMKADDRMTMFFSYATVLAVIGQQSVAPGPLEEAVGAYREALAFTTSESDPIKCALVGYYLGTALKSLGERKSGITELKEAETSLRGALLEFTRESYPEYWAQIQFDLGVVLTELGDREHNPEEIKEAVQTFHEEEKLPHQTGSLRPAEAQFGLGSALFQLGTLEEGTSTLYQSVDAFGVALMGFTRTRAPINWAATENSLGAVLVEIGKRETSSAKTRFSEAATDFRDALEETTHERTPAYWAQIQENLGKALSELGEHENGKTSLEEAAQAYREALKEYTRENAPLEWASIQVQLGNALENIGQRESGTGRFEEAVQAFGEALKETTREHSPTEWAKAEDRLGVALGSLGQRQNDTNRLVEAATALRGSLEVLTRNRFPMEWATTENDLAFVLVLLGERETGTAKLEEAARACHEALKERTRERFPLEWASTEAILGDALADLGNRVPGTEMPTRALRAFDLALEEFTPDVAPFHRRQVQMGREWTLKLLEARREQSELATRRKPRS